MLTSEFTAYDPKRNWPRCYEVIAPRGRERDNMERVLAENMPIMATEKVDFLDMVLLFVVAHPIIIRWRAGARRTITLSGTSRSNMGTGGA